MTENLKRRALWTAVELAWEMGYTIALPLVLFAVGGRFVDRWLGTAPWLMLIGIAIAITASSVAITRKIKNVCRVEFSDGNRKKNE